MLKEVELSHMPPGLKVYVALYRDVTNAKFLREQLLNGNGDYEFAFIDAKAILSTRHLLAAVFRAINDMATNRMKSRNIHSEIVFSLSANNNISESFRKFGVTDLTSNLLVVKVSDLEARLFQQILDEGVDGVSIEFNDENISKSADEAYIRKTYKIPKSKQENLDLHDQQQQQQQHNDLELSILGNMALRGSN